MNGETSWEAPEPNDEPLTSEQRAIIEGLEADLAVQLAFKPRRLAHSLAVGREAERLARIYGVSPFEARVAGILHDWEKILDDSEAIERAAALGIDLGVDLSRLGPLLHGPIAARTLPARYPWLSEGVLSAIERHTLGASDMRPLDMVVFVADGIEPGRGSVVSLDAQRELVGRIPLFDLWWRSFRDGIVYVVETSRYLYPGSVRVFNEVVERLRAGGGTRMGKGTDVG